MKFIILMHLLPLLAAEPNCVDLYENHCTGFELSAAIPVPIRDPDTSYRVILDQATGTIGAKTLSNLQNTRVLTIQNSTISHVDDGVLCALPELMALVIRTNKEFPALTKGLLRGCSQLSSLSIDGQVQPDAFEDLSNLWKLSIVEGNEFPKLTKEYFESLTQLKTLELKVEGKIDTDVLCSLTLEEAYIKTNFLPVTKTLFRGCTKIEGLFLRHTGKTRVDITEDAFSELPQLKRLELTNFNVNHLTKEFFKNIQDLSTLGFINSNLENIDRDAFQELRNLTILTLSENGFTLIEPNMFQDLRNLFALDLSKNNLKFIHDITGLPNLKALNVRDNSLIGIDLDKVRRNLPSLEEIAAGNNPLRRVKSEKLFVDFV